MNKTTYIQKWNILKDYLDQQRKDGGNLILISEIQDKMANIEFPNKGA